MARLLIVEEALKNRNGHWYEYNRAIVEEARKQQHEVTLLAHQDIDSTIEEELQATPFFPVTSWDQVYYSPSAVRRYWGILQHNRLIARLLTRHFQAQNQPYDVVLVPTTVLYHWLAWRWLVFRGHKRWFRRVVLTTRNNAGEYDPEINGYRFNESAKVLALILKSFRKPAASGVAEFASDSEKLCEQYNALSGLPFKTYPHPRTTEHLPLPAPQLRSELVFSALGPPRFEKGSDLVVEAIQKILADNPGFPGRFVLHWTNSAYSPDGQEIHLPEEWNDHPKVEIIRDSLGSTEYQQRIDEADVLLLPYRRAQYHARLSGIIIEAFQSGKACICISNTWLSNCLAKIGKGISMDEESSDALKSAIETLAKDPSSVRFTNDEIQEARQAHSPGAFVDLLVGKGSPRVAESPLFDELAKH